MTNAAPRTLALLAATIALPVAVACTPPDDEAAPPTGCEALVREASLTVEPDDQVDALDTALVACATYTAFGLEVSRYPGIIGYDLDTYLSLRCERADNERVRATPACDGIVGPGTTPPPVTMPELVFVGDTLDGRQVEIRPSNLVEFDGDVPAVVQQTVDIAVESGCPGVIAQFDLWAGRIDDPLIGDEASVFAQHALNVAAYIECEPWEPATVDG